MTYILGKHSRREFKGVHPDLIRVAERAIEITEQDFTNHDGIRMDEEQREYVRTGVSRTMASKHLRQPDGYGHAMDLVPYINGKLRWEMEACYEIARAVQKAARELGVPIRWGGCWGRLDTSTRDPALLVEEYVTRRRRQGRRPFIDGPHYELA